jgi:hypothetical protein
MKPTTPNIQDGQPALTEADVAGECVYRIAQGVQRSWPEIFALIGPLVGESAARLDAPDAWLDFGLAAMAVRIQAFAEALVPEDAERIRTAILNQVCRNHGAVRRQAVEQYERAWHDSITAGEAPLDCVACLLCDRWGIACAGPAVRSRGKDPLVVMLLGTVLLTWATSWPHRVPT